MHWKWCADDWEQKGKNVAKCKTEKKSQILSQNELSLMWSLLWSQFFVEILMINHFKDIERRKKRKKKWAIFVRYQEMP